MGAFVLVIIILGGNSGGITHVGNFKSLKSCEGAAFTINKAKHLFSVQTFCVNLQ